MTRVISIQGITVPNPEALKFETEGVLLTREAWEFTNASEAEASPLAKKLFSLGYVDRVFITGNFITVNKKENESPDWNEAGGDIRIIIRKHLENSEPLFNPWAAPLEEIEPLTENEKAVAGLLAERILPATWSDGGEIRFESLKDGTVKVKLHGACAGCPFAPRTIKSGVEELLKNSLAGINEVTSDDVDWSQTQQEETGEHIE